MHPLLGGEMEMTGGGGSGGGAANGGEWGMWNGWQAPTTSSSAIPPGSSTVIGDRERERERDLEGLMMDTKSGMKRNQTEEK